MKYPTPEDLLSVSTRKLTKLLGKASRGRCGKGKAEQLKAAAAESFGVSFATEAFAFQIRQLIEQLEFLEGQIAELEEQISILLKRTGSYITTIPGIGDTPGAIILSEIGDIHRFGAPSKLVAFAGLDVKVTQSGSLPAPGRRFPSAAHRICGGLSGWPPPGRLFATLPSPPMIRGSVPAENTI